MPRSKPFSENKKPPAERVEVFSLGLTQDEVNYLIRAMEVDYRRITAWLERTSSVNKAEEVNYRMSICESLTQRLRGKKAEF